MRLLLVDDDPDIRLLLGSYLEAEGHQVETAADGEEGLRRARESLPEVILLDCVMPVLDGVETLRRLRRDPLTVHLPVIFLTALQGGPEVDEARSLGGVTRVIPKPVMPEALVHALDELASPES